MWTFVQSYVDVCAVLCGRLCSLMWTFVQYLLTTIIVHHILILILKVQYKIN